MKVCQILLVVLLSSCAYDPGDNRLVIVNRTNHEITLYWNSDTIPEYPSVNHTEVYLMSYSIKKGLSESQPEDNANWPKFVRNSMNGKLNLFVYDTDSLRSYNNIDSLNTKKMYKRLEYSLEELNRLNWEIVIK